MLSTLRLQLRLVTNKQTNILSLLSSMCPLVLTLILRYLMLENTGKKLINENINNNYRSFIGADITGSDVPSSAVCWRLKEGWGPMSLALVGNRKGMWHQLPLMECTSPPLLFLHCRLRRTRWDGVKEYVKGTKGNRLNQVHLERWH